MVLGKKVAIFNWEWDRNSAPREGQKRLRINSIFLTSRPVCCQHVKSLLRGLSFELIAKTLIRLAKFDFLLI